MMVSTAEVQEGIIPPNLKTPIAYNVLVTNYVLMRFSNKNCVDIYYFHIHTFLNHMNTDDSYILIILDEKKQTMKLLIMNVNLSAEKCNPKF
jgi:hypothetical protein